MQKMMAIKPESAGLEAGNAKLVVQRASEIEHIPGDRDFLRWAQSALAQRDACFELTIRVVEENESRQLNRSYRDRNKATNVLSFPSALPDEIQIELQTRSGCRVLGDLVICAPVVNREAGLQGKPPGDHWAHLVIHGILHLLGFDHEQEERAAVMERTETEILNSLGIPDPYISR
jgi:probable rRNA maturation factor